MDIRLVSTLTRDDEERIAYGLLDMLAAVLDNLPIAYRLRIDTASGAVFHTERRVEIGSEAVAELERQHPYWPADDGLIRH